MYRYLSVMAATAAFFLGLAGTPALAQGTCSVFSGAAFGLCNAYCEAMACGSGDPQASDNACTKVQLKFESLDAGDLPCLSEPTNAAPEVDLSGDPDDGTFNTTATFVSFGKAVPIAVNVKITDADGTDTITSATVTLTNPLDGADETLSLSPAGLVLLEGLNDPAGGSWDFDVTLPGALTITGTGTLEQYELILQQVVYDNALDAPTIEPDPVRTISVAVSDGTAPSNTAVSTLTVEHGCPCKALSNGHMASLWWPWFRSELDARTQTVRSWWGFSDTSSGRQTCEIGGVGPTKTGFRITLHFDTGIVPPWTEEGPNQEVDLADVILTIETSQAGDDIGQCLQSIDALKENRRWEPLLGFEGVIVTNHFKANVEDRKTTIDDFPRLDPNPHIDTYTPQMHSACAADQVAFVEWMRGYYSARGLTCVDVL